jgi:hypothetical protein
MVQPRLETIAQRTVYSEDGVRWRVREATAFDVPGAQASSCLIFDGGSICRRFWLYPLEWGTMPELSLLAIMDRPR